MLDLAEIIGFDAQAEAYNLVNQENVSKRAVFTPMRIQKFTVYGTVSNLHRPIPIRAQPYQ